MVQSCLSDGHWRLQCVFSWLRAFLRQAQYPPVQENGCCWARRQDGSPRRVRRPGPSGYSVARSRGLWKPRLVYLTFLTFYGGVIIPHFNDFFQRKKAELLDAP